MKKKYKMKILGSNLGDVECVAELEEIKDEEPKKASKKEINKAFQSGGFTTYEGFKFIEPKGLERKMSDKSNCGMLPWDVATQIARDEAVRVFDKAIPRGITLNEDNLNTYLNKARQALKSM